MFLPNTRIFDTVCIAVVWRTGLRVMRRSPSCDREQQAALQRSARALQACAFTLIDDEIGRLSHIIRHFKEEGGGLPRSQLFNLLHEAHAKRLLNPANKSGQKTFLENDVAATFTRVDAAYGLFESSKSPELGYTADAPLLPLIRLAEFWDYVDPIRPEDRAQERAA